MNYSLLSKLGGVLLSAGGFGFSSWLFWPAQPTTHKYLYLYTVSETLSGSDNSEEKINKNINKNFDCKISNKSYNIPCDILEPDSNEVILYSATSSTQSLRFKANPEKLTKTDLKTANNVYVLKISDKYKKDIEELGASGKIEVVSTKEKNKKYASLKLNLVLDEDGIIVPSANNSSGTSSTINPAITTIQNQLNTNSSTSTKDTQKIQEQMLDIISDSNKLGIANKLFEECANNTTPKKFGCENISKSLDMLVTKFKNKPDGTPNVIMQNLLNQDSTKVNEFFSDVNKLETIIETTLTASTTTTKDKQKTQEQMLDIISDSNKLGIANKLFEDCTDSAKKPAEFSCTNINKSLDILTTQLQNKDDGKPNEITQNLLNKNKTEVNQFFSAVNTLETIITPKPATNTNTPVNPKRQSQMIEIVKDPNKLNIADKVFKDCENNPQSFGCTNIDKSLEILTTKIKNTSDSKSNDLTQALASRTGKEISTFLSVVDKTEQLKQELSPSKVLDKLFGFFKSST